MLPASFADLVEVRDATERDLGADMIGPSAAERADGHRVPAEALVDPVHRGGDASGEHDVKGRMAAEACSNIADVVAS